MGDVPTQVDKPAGQHGQVLITLETVFRAVQFPLYRQPNGSTILRPLFHEQTMLVSVGLPYLQERGSQRTKRRA